MAKRKQPTKKRMKVRLDNAVRLYIKERDSDTCVTCGQHKLSTVSKTLDWSHKVSRNNLFLRWDERNSLAQCRGCHNKWGCGINTPMNKAIDTMWGPGTAERLEQFATRNTTIKGTELDQVEYRLKLESFYKKKLKALQEGHITPEQSRLNLWEEYTNLSSQTP